MFLPHPRVKVSIVGSLRDQEVACLASSCQGSNFESCVWRTVSSQSSHHPQEVLLAQFSLYVHKGGLKPDSFHFIRRPEKTQGKYMDLFIFALGRISLHILCSWSNNELSQLGCFFISILLRNCRPKSFWKVKNILITSLGLLSNSNPVCFISISPSLHAD